MVGRSNQSTKWRCFHINYLYRLKHTWNVFFFPLIFIYDPEWKTLAQGLTMFFGEYSINYGVLYAGLTLAALPIVVIFIIQSKQFFTEMTS